jgi:hypothetical protein
VPRDLSDRRLRLGRLQVYIEPRDAWIGVYVAPDAVYVLLLPFLVLRWARPTVNLGRHLRLIHVARAGCDDCSVEPGERHRYAGCPGNRRAAECAAQEVS